MLPLDGDFIMRVAPTFSGEKAKAQAGIVSAISGAFASELDRYAINTPLRIAHFMAQVTHECAGFRTTEEFASGAAYEGRSDLGNTERGDGVRYKGRGLIQLTGRANYRRMGTRLDRDLEGTPTLAADPLISLTIACEYWKDHGLNALADADDLVAITKRINGGLNGLDDRGTYLKRAKAAIAEILGVAVGVEQGTGVPVLRRGSRSDAVGELQRLLREAGFQLAVDNEFGAATELAVRMFQAQQGLQVDGVVAAVTWDALRAIKAQAA